MVSFNLNSSTMQQIQECGYSINAKPLGAKRAVILIIEVQ